MPTVKVRDLNNKETGSIELSDAVFGAEFNESLIHSAVRNYLANRRQGTAQTKTRGNVRGGGRKPWRQKGTGRARVASIRSPLWRGGGRVHGPIPKDWSYNMPKKMRRGAIRSALSERLREGNIIVVDEITLDAVKTKGFIAILKSLGLEDGDKRTKTLFVDQLDNTNLIMSSRNVQRTKVVNSFGVNAYDVVYHEKIVMTKQAAEELNTLLNPIASKNSMAEEVA